jgi:hypothetical protein
MIYVSGTLGEGIPNSLFRVHFSPLLGENDSPDRNRLQKMANSGTQFWNTPLLPDLRQTDGNSRRKMYANVRYWEAKPGVHGGVARSWGKEGLLWGPKMTLTESPFEILDLDPRLFENTNQGPLF